jgi:hypothetical protein
MTPSNQVFRSSIDATAFSKTTFSKTTFGQTTFSQTTFGQTTFSKTTFSQRTHHNKHRHKRKDRLLISVACLPVLLSSYVASHCLSVKLQKINFIELFSYLTKNTNCVARRIFQF